MLDLTKLCLTLQTVAAITVLFFPQSARVAGVDGEPVRTYLVYDQQRSKLTQLLDGLAIQFRILISAQVSPYEKKKSGLTILSAEFI